MAIPILRFWEKYFENPDEGMGSTYERFIINDVLLKTVEHYGIKTVLETPSFGFTGLSGINSLGLALNGISVAINDSEIKRLRLIKEVWSRFDTDVSSDLIEDFCELPYEDKSFDMVWNFSALWFVNDLEKFLYELSRVSNKVILIMVPNRSGLGYLHQKYTGANDLKNKLHEGHIEPENFIKPLENLGWRLMCDSLIDCPLWPDIGMSKEDFLQKLGLSFLSKKSKATKAPLSILNYYNGSEPDMKARMLQLDLFEKHAPVLFKKIWAHHHYYLFSKV